MTDAALADAVDAVLDRATTGDPGVPGAVVVLTDRDGNVYERAAGVRQLGLDTPMSLDTVFQVHSTTKAITATACLQLVEEGSLDLDAPAKQYVPDLGAIEVLDGFDADGAPVLRPPKRDVTTRMLLLHTGGFGYDFSNEDAQRLAKPPFEAPMLFDPGERWEYGWGIDWAGRVVEGITGARLGDVLEARVLGPLGMTDTAFVPTASMRDRLSGMHFRDDAGQLSAMAGVDLAPADDVEHLGGQGLFSTAVDYVKFIRMWLNDGVGPAGPVIRPETVALAVRNGLGDLRVTKLPGVIPSLANDAEFFPGMPKSWSLAFMLNDEDAPTGRPAGSLAWAGLANLYYWIDRRNGIGGFWASQVFPFFDPPALGGFLDVETAAYQYFIGG